MSLYLKYRPADFKNLVGQSFVKDTLQKAIENDKTVGAYLFCGPRGTGKTSSARIFAKAINCLNPTKGNPCLECNICTSFANESLMDIIEIDAASNTGVDNIRELIERAQFQPTNTKYKIYIIDEVHMLSKGAFNALLKILEEPPSHVKFILATTETHKVPETIISRCQRYDFKRISNIDVKERLEYIAKEEGIKIDEKSVSYIIKNSAGGLRNAISLFEQLISDSEINYDIIVDKLEIVDENVIDTFLEKLLKKDSSVIEIFDKTIDDGKNIKIFFKELLFYTKTKSINELRLNNNITNYIEILDILDDTYTKTKHSLDENTTFLIGILKILNGYNKNILENNNIQNKQVNITSSNISNEKINNEIPRDIVSATQISSTHQISNDGISHDDLNDIFGDFNETTDEIKIVPKSNGGIFDTTTFIDKMKSNGAKGGLTIALKGALMSINGNNLIIGVSNKIQKGQVENVDNMALIIKSLNDMGIENPTITIN